MVFYVAVFLLLAVLLSTGTSLFCAQAIDRIYEAYSVSGERYYLTNDQGERLGDGAIISSDPSVSSLSASDQRRIGFLELFPSLAVPIYSGLCILAAALLFYRNKLKEPLRLLRKASEKISGNDLDFSIPYPSQDELGQLCASFETMRQALRNTYRDLWRQAEEHRRLNAAFAHDLRTPLTVIKGCHELLMLEASENNLPTITAMGNHIQRLEQYADSMSRLQRLEEAVPERKNLESDAFFASLEETARLLCRQGEKALIFSREPAGFLDLDPELCCQVFENLLANAIRFARSTVRVHLGCTSTHLLLTVTDDGPGFSREALLHAADPYYSQDTGGQGHLGLGLYICRLLCQSHGGELSLQNVESDPLETGSAHVNMGRFTEGVQSRLVARENKETGTRLSNPPVIRGASCTASFCTCPKSLNG